MARVYKTSRGKLVDMDQIKLANENVVSVGNMKVNARGDAIGAGGQIAAGRNQIMDQVYAVKPDNGYSPNDPERYAERKAAIQAATAKELSELANNLVVPIVPTDSKLQVPATTTETAARGSLASSIAKPTTVVQEALPNSKLKKPSGPSRI